MFVTAHSEHAVQAFDVAAVDYLVKPVEIKRLRTAIERLAPAAEGTPRIDRIPVEKGGRKRSACYRQTDYSLIEYPPPAVVSRIYP